MAAILLSDSKNSRTFFEGIFDITAPIKTDNQRVGGFQRGKYIYRVVDIGTDITVSLEVSEDGSTYSPVADADIRTTNGTFTIEYTDETIVAVRLSIDAFTGGTPKVIVHSEFLRFTNPSPQIGGDDFSSQIENALRAAQLPTIDNPFGTLDDLGKWRKELEFQNIVEPPQLAGSVNDYNPAGFDTGGVNLLSIDAAAGAPKVITGLQAPANPIRAKAFVIYNRGVGGGIITLSNNNGLSLAANRFVLSGMISLTSNQGLWCIYSPTLSRYTALIP